MIPASLTTFMGHFDKRLFRQVDVLLERVLSDAELIPLSRLDRIC